MEKGLNSVYSRESIRRKRSTGNLNGGVKLALLIATVAGSGILASNLVDGVKEKKATARAQEMATVSPRVVYVQARAKERGFWSGLGHAALYGNGNNNNGNLSSSVVEANMAQLWNHKVFGNDEQNVSLGGRIYRDNGNNNYYGSGYHSWRNGRNRRSDAHATFDQPSND